MDVKMKKIKTEVELKDWFENNFKKLGYSEIIKKDNGTFPDFIMLRDNKEIKVELETLSSNFLLHNHNVDKVDELVCIKNDITLNVPITEINELEFIGNKKRISATVDEKTEKIIEELLNKSVYRNKSHVIEEAIKFLKEKVKGGKK